MRPQYTCPHCGIVFTADLRPGRVTPKFCSNACYHATPRVTVETFWDRVDRSGGPDACWPWLGCKARRGYGVAWWEKKKVIAHRVAFFITHHRWPIPDCLHHCDNPPCCNPAHLFEGTHGDNANDRIAKGRSNPPHGEAHWRAKLTADDIREIRRLIASGMTQAEIGRRYGVSSATACNIVKRKVWKHVE